MVRHGHRGIRTTHAAPGHPQAFESLRTCHLVDEVPVDVEDARPVLETFDDMIVPDLVKRVLGELVTGILSLLRTV